MKPLPHATLAASDSRRARRAHFALDHREDRGKQKKVGELRIELRSAALGDHVGGFGVGPAVPVTAAMSDCIDGIRDGDYPGRERNLPAAEPARIARAVPSLVVREDTLRQVRIEGREWSQDLRPAAWMRGDRVPLGIGQGRPVVNDVEQRLVDLSDVVKEGDTLDGKPRPVIELGGFGKCQRISCDPPDVGAGLVIVGVDGVEERFQRSSGETFRCTTSDAFAVDASACDGSADGEGTDGESEVTGHAKLRAQEPYGVSVGHQRVRLPSPNAAHPTAPRPEPAAGGKDRG